MTKQPVLPGDFLESADPTLRQRSFGHIPVFWAWLAQILEANASCQRAVGFIQSWCRTCGLSVPSSDTSSYCKARLRVDIRFLHAIHRRIRDHLGARISGADRWQGFNLVAMDGSSVQLRDTAANQRAYPQPSGQKPGCGFPTMGIVGLVNLCHGGWEQVVACPHTRHDSRAAGGLIAHLHAGDLLLADRAFCSYELIARCQGRGAHALMRLHQARAKSLDWREGKRISAYERIVTWTRPQRPPGSGLSPAEWEALPASMELRLIKVRYENRAGEKGELIVVTTLTDPSRHCGMELADLYARRWDIELKLRDLKTTMGMERFDVNTPEMAQKTLLMGVIAFNLIRSVMQRAADRAGEPTRHMSFKGDAGSGGGQPRELPGARGPSAQTGGGDGCPGGNLRDEEDLHPPLQERTEGGETEAQTLSVPNPPPLRIRGNPPPQSIQKTGLIPCHSSQTSMIDVLIF
ncbi:MAG: IS4 family transposase [Akkermansiaceae bacterium]|nr:IS4 family transposase [Akkermansiaceae bacterium]